MNEWLKLTAFISLDLASLIWKGTLQFPKHCRDSSDNICIPVTFQVNKIALSCIPSPILSSLEQRNLTLETEMMSLHDELDQERKKFTMIEIKMRNAERAKEDAEKRNDMLQKEMEQFFSTFGELTVEPRRTERGNTIWIQWAHFFPLSPMDLGRALRFWWEHSTGSGGWFLAVQCSNWWRNIIYRHYPSISAMCTKVLSCPIMLLSSVTTGFVYRE